MLRPVAPSAAPELHDSARWVGAGRGAHVVAHDCLRDNVRLKSTLVQPLLEIGLLRKHVEALVERARDFDRGAAQHEGTTTCPVDRRRCSRDALLDTSLAKREQTDQACRRVGKTKRRCLMATIGVADGRGRDRHLGVGVEVGNEGIDGAGLDRGVIVEDQVILGCALLE